MPSLVARKMARAVGIVQNHRYDRNRLRFRPGARLAPTVALYQRLSRIPGYFTYEDATHFELILRMQRANGVKGDALEIGSYFGRSAALIRSVLEPGEQLTIIDPFEGETVYRYHMPPTRNTVEQNILLASPGSAGGLEFIESFSTDVVLPEERRFRFVHIDGSHEHADVISDLRLGFRDLVPGGVIAVDDFEHPDWPGVTSAAREFLPHPELLQVGDFNRQSEAGRKLYLAKPL